NASDHPVAAMDFQLRKRPVPRLGCIALLRGFFGFWFSIFGECRRARTAGRSMIADSAHSVLLGDIVGEARSVFK
ncbi:MAG TPA: hypothetical protein PKA76_14255, partial [Pirellulaceae bacterium]|nr:hypothetical protein [Pirellulaceae bacterium]